MWRLFLFCFILTSCSVSQAEVRAKEVSQQLGKKLNSLTVEQIVAQPTLLRLLLSRANSSTLAKSSRERLAANKLKTIFQNEGTMLLHLHAARALLVASQVGEGPKYSAIATEYLRLLKAQLKPPFTQLGAEERGVLVETYAYATQATGDKQYLEFAERLVQGLSPHAAGTQSLVDGLITLYETGFNPRWLKLAEEMLRKLGSQDRSPLRLLSAARLFDLTANDYYQKLAAAEQKLLETKLLANQKLSAEALKALDFALAPRKEVAIIALDSDNELLRTIHRGYYPYVSLCFGYGASSYPLLLERKQMLGGKATAYVCEQGYCKLPVTTGERLKAQLRGQDEE